jgi:UDPglucose 6-dehydrogenase
VIVGAGVVGTATGKGLARRGHAVSFVDVSSDRIDALRSEGLAASDTVDLSGPETAVFVSVPTPSGPAPAGYDLSSLSRAVAAIGSAIAGADEFPLVVTRSTVPPGTCEGVVRPVLEETSGMRQGDGFSLASNPEFLRAACALEDFLHPRMTVIGSRSKATLERLVDLYRPFGGEVRVYDNPAMAELVKITHNLFNAAKISFWNEVWLLSEQLGLDGGAVGEAVALSAEASWNPGYGIKGGRPFGGACLPKDTRGFVAFAEEAGVQVPLAAAVERVNELVGGALSIDLRDHAGEPVDVEHRRRR